MTIGKAFQTRTDCEKGKWSEEKDTRGRSIVTYTCSLPERYLSYFNQVTTNRLNQHISPYNEELKKTIEGTQSYKARIDESLQLFEDTKDKTNDIINNIQAILSDINSKDLKSLTSQKLMTALYLTNNEYTEREVMSFDRFTEDLFNSDYAELNPDDKEKYSHLLHKAYKLHTEYFDMFMYAASKSNNESYAFEAMFKMPKIKLRPYYDTIGHTISDQLSSHIHNGALFNYDTTLGKLIDDLELNSKQVTQTLDVYSKDLIRRAEVIATKDEKLNIEKAKNYTTWLVTDTGGVELLSSGIEAIYAGKTASVNFKNPNIVPTLAYQDYKENDVPKAYTDIMIDMLKKDYGALISSILKPYEL